MSRSPSSPTRRYWYSVSTTSLRRLLTAVSVVALVVAALVGQRVWERSQRKDRAQLLLTDCAGRVDGIAERLGAADARRQHGDLWEQLEKARAAFDGGDFELAAELGQRCLAVADSVLNPDPAAIHVLRVAGGVESRRSQDAPWRPLDGGGRLRFGDWVKTSANGSAELVFAGGASLTLRPGTMVHLDAQLTDLAFGDLEVATTVEERTVTTPGARARFGRGTEGQVSVASDGSTSRVMVAEGEAEVTTEAGATRRLERLEQLAREGESWSGVAPVLGRPQLLEPVNRRVIDPAAGEVTLAWSPIDGARGYRLQVAASPLFTDALVDDERTATVAALAVGQPGSFSWRVAAVDAQGTPGPWSRPRTFRIGIETAARRDRVPPRLRIDDVATFGDMVIITGLTEPDAEVTVQGEAAIVHIDGTFRMTVELKYRGRQTIRIVATDSAGNRTVRTREVVVL